MLIQLRSYVVSSKHRTSEKNGLKKINKMKPNTPTLEMDQFVMLMKEGPLGFKMKGITSELFFLLTFRCDSHSWALPKLQTKLSGKTGMP